MEGCSCAHKLSCRRSGNDMAKLFLDHARCCSVRCSMATYYPPGHYAVTTEAFARRTAVRRPATAKGSHRSSRDVSVTSAGETPQGAVAATTAGNLHVQVAFRFWCSDAKSQCVVSHCEVEQRLMLNDAGREAFYHVDQCFDHCASTSAVADAVVPQLLGNAMSGRSQLVAVAGGHATGKTTTMLAQDGLVQSVSTQLLYEVERQGLHELLQVVCSAVEVVGDDIVDVVAASDFPCCGTAELPHHHGTGTFDARCFPIETSADASALREVMLADAGSPARHTIVILQAVPRGGASNAFTLMKAIAPVVLVELNAGLRTSAVADAQHSKRVRHGSQMLFNVAAAQLRRAHEEVATGRSRIHVPVRDSVLTDVLSDFLIGDGDNDIVFLFHCNAGTYSKSLQSTLDLAHWLSASRFPNGVPAPDYRTIAHSQQRKLDALRNGARKDDGGLQKVIEDLRRENLALQKAYEAAVARGSGAVGVTADNEHPHACDMQHNEIRALRELLVAAEEEASILRAQLHNAHARVPRAQSSSIQPAAKQCRSVAVDAGVPLPDVPLPDVRGTELAAALASVFAAGVVNEPTRGSVESSGAAVIIDLVRQCCAREKAYEYALTNAMLDDVSDTLSPASTPHRRGDSSELERRAAAMKTQLDHAPLLGWQRWRALLNELAHIDSWDAVPPGDRSCLRVPPSTALQFQQWWFHRPEFDVTDRSTVASPPSALDAVLREY